MTRARVFVGALASAGLACAAAAAPIGLTGSTQMYTQDFDSLADDGSGNLVTSWEDDVTIEAWYVDGANPGFDAPGTVLSLNTTAPSGSRFHDGTATERALGFRNFNSAGDWYQGVQFENTSGSAIEYETIAASVVVEKWQDRGGDENVALAYKITSTGGNILDSSGWVTLDSAVILDDASLAGTTNLDGNLAVNQTLLSGSVSDITLAPGQFLTFRYFDDNISGNDNALAIDDFSATLTVPEPGTVSLAGLGALCLLRRRR